MKESKSLPHALISKHELVPKHEVMKQKEAGEVLLKLGVSPSGLPKIRNSDPAIEEFGAKPGDIVRITRKEITSENTYYRLVVK